MELQNSCHVGSAVVKDNKQFQCFPVEQNLFRSPMDGSESCQSQCSDLLAHPASARIFRVPLHQGPQRPGRAPWLQAQHLQSVKSQQGCAVRHQPGCASRARDGGCAKGWPWQGVPGAAAALPSIAPACTHGQGSPRNSASLEQRDGGGPIWSRGIGGGHGLDST